MGRAADLRAARHVDIGSRIDGFGTLQLVAFHAVDDGERMRMNPDPSEFDAAAFSCGLFELTKPPAA